MEAAILLGDPVSAHAQIAALWPKLKPELISGHRHVLEVRPHEDKLTDQQRRYYHGHILTEIARQAMTGKFALPVWKEYFRDKFLGTKRRSVTNPITGRKSRRRVRVSTEDLGVRGYTQLIEQVTAYAVTDLDVNFDMTFGEYINQETGEILTRAGI